MLRKSNIIFSKELLERCCGPVGAQPRPKKTNPKLISTTGVHCVAPPALRVCFVSGCPSAFLTSRTCSDLFDTSWPCKPAAPFATQTDTRPAANHLQQTMSSSSRCFWRSLNFSLCKSFATAFGQPLETPTVNQARPA